VRPRVLVVDDDAALRYMLREALDEADLEVELASDGQEALDRLQKGRYDLVLSDLRMPRVDGLALLAASRALHPAPRLILMTAHGSERLAVDAMKQGAWDYLRKPFELDELRAVVNRAVETARLRAENERLSGVAALSRSMVFASPAMERLSVLVQRVAPRDVTVLITGENLPLRKSRTPPAGPASRRGAACPSASRPCRPRAGCAASRAAGLSSRRAR
jgi:DNA-binding NtrC family response regulator